MTLSLIFVFLLGLVVAKLFLAINGEDVPLVEPRNKKAAAAEKTEVHDSIDAGILNDNAIAQTPRMLKNPKTTDFFRRTQMRNVNRETPDILKSRGNMRAIVLRVEQEGDPADGSWYDAFISKEDGQKPDLEKLTCRIPSLHGGCPSPYDFPEGAREGIKTHLYHTFVAQTDSRRTNAPAPPGSAVWVDFGDRVNMTDPMYVRPGEESKYGALDSKIKISGKGTFDDGGAGHGAVHGTGTRPRYRGKKYGRNSLTGKLSFGLWLDSVPGGRPKTEDAAKKLAKSIKDFGFSAVTVFLNPGPTQEQDVAKVCGGWANLDKKCFTNGLIANVRPIWRWSALYAFIKECREVHDLEVRLVDWSYSIPEVLEAQFKQASKIYSRAPYDAHEMDLEESYKPRRLWGITDPSEDVVSLWKKHGPQGLKLAITAIPSSLRIPGNIKAKLFKRLANANLLAYVLPQAYSHFAAGGRKSAGNAYRAPGPLQTRTGHFWGQCLDPNPYSGAPPPNCGAMIRDKWRAPVEMGLAAWNLKYSNDKEEQLRIAIKASLVGPLTISRFFFWSSKHFFNQDPARCQQRPRCKAIHNVVQLGIKGELDLSGTPLVLGGEVSEVAPGGTSR